MPLENGLTQFENTVRPVLERINNATTRVGSEDVAAVGEMAWWRARKAGLVLGHSERGWYMTERGRLLLSSIRQRAGIL